MRIDTRIKYEESYLPTKRHRIPRIREVEEAVSVELREVRKEDAPIALVVTNFQSYVDEQGNETFGLRETPYIAYDGHLYSEERDMRGALDQGPYPIEDLQKAIARAGSFHSGWDGTSREDMLRAVNKFASSRILLDDVIYVRRGEPRYVVNTFGLGHNHGGTGMFIENHYNENICKECYFNALQRDEAIAYANHVAEGRGDTKDIGKFGRINIEVYMPEMVRCNPQLEHGEGNSFLNEVENLVRLSSTANEAAILVTMGRLIHRGK